MILYKYFITSGIGVAKTSLTSFDAALINARLANYNIVKVSSILPVNAIRSNDVDLVEGSIIYTAYSSLSTDEINKTVSAAVAVGIPKDKTKIGVIMECSCFNKKENTENKVKEMVAEAMNVRGYEIEEILVDSCEVVSDGENFVTAFAALAMWEN